MSASPPASPTRNPLAIVADDLSGAADCGVAFAMRGWHTALTLAGERAAEADIVAVDAHTRALDAAAAAATTEAVTRAFAPAGTALLRKIDSTLRGHVAVELAAALRMRPGSVAVFAPSFPAHGRTVRGGHAFLHGAPLEQSETWRHERMAGTGSVAALLGAAGLRVAVLELATIRGGDAAATMAAAARTHDVLACDAETDDDLARIVAAGTAALANPVWTGSAGLAHAIAAARGRGAAMPPAVPRAERPLVVVGSVSAVSRRQVAALRAATPLVPVELDPASIEQGGARIARALDGPGALVTLTADAAPDLRQGRVISAALGRLLAPHLARADALVATGGETARAILDAAGHAALRLVGEVRPGIPVSLAGRLPVITKAGAFGADDALLACYVTLCTPPAGHEGASP